MAVLEREIEIVYNMAQRILQYEDSLVKASDICGELDRYVGISRTLILGLIGGKSSRPNTGRKLLQAEPTTHRLRKHHQYKLRPVRIIISFQCPQADPLQALTSGIDGALVCSQQYIIERGTSSTK